MPETGLYTGYNDDLYMRWNVTRSDEDGRTGTVSIFATRLFASDYEFSWHNVEYSRGGWPWHSLNLDKGNAELQTFARLLCTDIDDWSGLSHGSDWIEALGIKFKKH
ncbi:hypothetical protein FOL47_000856 [Perkinsus chesapeaki]|uniref:Uncharacterized protein n=1 Tax=Perkinsus chesapeaki TaxID=330153 RepID=A0A7J6MKM1_PERCH|nr:hypothetical protein FOL47_000856 [Perkinsus chesapeaki]